MERPPMKEVDDAELLAWLDGDLTPERRAEIQQLLESDWELRTALAQLEKRINKYVEATAHQSPAEIEPFDDFWNRLARQIKTQPAPKPTLSTRQAWLTQLFASFRAPGYGWRVASLAAIVLLLAGAALIYLSFSNRMHSVSAEELLQRALQGEALRLQQQAEPVVYRKLRVRRAGEAILWESWNDARRQQFRQRVSDQAGMRFVQMSETTVPTLLAELEEVFRTNHFDVRRPLSAAAFADWRKSATAVTETVTSAGDELTLTTTVEPPHAIKAITEALLVVRKSDWHAVALRLKVQGAAQSTEYELSEAAYEVLPSQALTVFADLPSAPALTVSSKVAAPVPVASASPMLTAALPSAADLRGAEVAALYALHQAQADLGEPLEVVRDGERQIVVRGLVQTAARKAELLQALDRIALVNAQIQTVEEALQQAQRAATAATAPEENTTNEIAAVSESSVASVSPFQRKVNEQFGARAGLSESEKQDINRKVSQFYNAVEADASAALAEAWALRRLQERFDAAAHKQLESTAQQQLNEMFGNHTARLRQRVRRLQSRLQPVLVSLAGDLPTVSALPETTQTTRLTATFRAVEQVRSLTDQLLTGKATQPVSQTSRTLLAELARLESLLPALEKELQ